MKCLKCGMEIHLGANFCWNCGQIVESGVVDAPIGQRLEPSRFETVKPVGPWPVMTGNRMTDLICRVFSGVGWLLVSIGTFIVAFGWLGVFDAYSSYYDDPLGSLRLIGYGIVIYAIAAIAFSIRELVRPPR